MNPQQMFALELRADSMNGDIIKHRGRHAVVWQADGKWHALLVDDVDNAGRVWWSGSATTAESRNQAIQALEN